MDSNQIVDEHLLVAAGMAELVDAGDLKSPGLYGCAGSIPALGTPFLHVSTLLEIMDCYSHSSGVLEEVVSSML